MNNSVRPLSRWLIAAVMGMAHLPMQAGVLEDLLSQPAIQNWLSKIPELRSAARRCIDEPAYRNQNPGICQQAIDAHRLLTMPMELRVLLATPSAARSLREICLALQGQPAQNSYLCAELYKADLAFKDQADQQRILRQDAENRP